MSAPNEQEYIGLGMDLGAYCLAQINTRVKMSPGAWQRFADSMAKQIEEQTGTPAEDLALQVMPLMEKLVQQITKESDE